MRDLFTLFEDNIAFIDYSSEARDYLRDSFQIDYVQADGDAIYLGLYKPYRQLFVELDTVAVANTGSITFEYWNGSSFASLSVIDESKNFTRNGFIKFDAPSDWSVSTINNEELYWIKITNDVDFDITFKGLNTVFSDDTDLKSENRTIDDLLAVGDSSFISYHVAARNEIVQSLRNGGHTTRVSGGKVDKDLTKWDFLIPEQIRNASKYLTLSKIMFDVSSNVDDKWYSRFKDYRDMYSDAFKLYLMAIDENDDGEASSVEQNNFRTVTLQKV